MQIPGYENVTVFIYFHNLSSDLLIFSGGIEIDRSSPPEVFWKYAANLQKNTYAKV